MKKPVATTDVKAIAAYYMIEKAKELLHEPAQPCSRAASGSAHHLLEPVTITMERRDWMLVRDYFEGDIVAMGDNAPQDQPRARKIQDWIKHRIQKGNSLKSEPNAKLCDGLE